MGFVGLLVPCVPNYVVIPLPSSLSTPPPVRARRHHRRDEFLFLDACARDVDYGAGQGGGDRVFFWGAIPVAVHRMRVSQGGGLFGGLGLMGVRRVVMVVRLCMGWLG